jgi:hypothetical protein
MPHLLPMKCYVGDRPTGALIDESQLRFRPLV